MAAELQEQVKGQYERFPYPAVGSLALPRRGQGEGLRYEVGVALAQAAGVAQGLTPDHRGKRILVVGAGTLEALVVAQTHPEAAEIVAVDISAASIRALKQRLRWAGLRDRIFRRRALPPISAHQSDLNHWTQGGYDYIIATNVLHHTLNPAASLKRLAALLKPGGLMRVVTYPAQSRHWIRQTSAWLAWHGLTPEKSGLARKARAAIRKLPSGHPIRSCYEGHGERMSATGVVDAFLHVLEQPLSPEQWQDASEAASLTWVGETQTDTSRGEFLSALLPATAALNHWQRLQVLDDVLELATNPIWWFVKRPLSGIPVVIDEEMENVTPDGRADMLWQGISVKEVARNLSLPWYLPSQPYFELARGARSAQRILGSVGATISNLMDALRREVGVRCSRTGRELPGLTLPEHDVAAMMVVPEPWSPEQWQQLEESVGADWHLSYEGKHVPGVGLAMQAQWLQLYYGCQQAQIGPIAFVRGR